MNIISDKEQDNILSKSLKKIKAQTYKVNNTISQNNLRQCLKETYILLNELRINTLTPKRYYNLYISIFDIMLTLKNYFFEEVSRGKILIDLYDKVQQAKNVIPRIYLMITVGSIYIEKVPKSVHVILFDLLGVVKQVQNPIKGLFVRNYLLKMVKDKLPDKNNIYEKQGGTFEDSLKFLIQNLEEMNLLWIRLLIGVDTNNKTQREKERDELKILIGESINKLSSLESLTKEIYEEQILPKLLKIIIDSKDILSQQYLMECIIHSFPDSYNIKCIEQILDTMTQLKQGVDICNLFINLMDKIGQFFGNEKNNNKDINDIIETAKNIYPVLLSNFEVILNKNIKNEKDTNNNNNINNIPLIILLDLICSFLKFSMKCSPEEQKNISINKILSFTVLLIKKFENKKTEDETKKIYEILLIPLNRGINIFELNEYYKLFELLDYFTKKKISKDIINIIVINKNKNIPKLNSIENFKAIMKFMQPLISDNKNKNKKEDISDIKTIEEEQNFLCKLLHAINSTDPEIIFELFVQFKNIFSYGGTLRQKFSLPCLVNAIIIFCHKLITCYENKNSNKNKDNKDKNNEKKKTKSKNKMNINIDKITNDELFHKLMTGNYKLLNEIMDLISPENPNIAFNLYIYISSSINELSNQKEKFSELCLSFINKALNLLENNPKLISQKVNLINYLSSYLINYKILSIEQKEKIVNILINMEEHIQNRGEQFHLMLILSQVYFSIFKNGKNVLDYLNKARRYADYDMAISKNICLYIYLMNKMIYFVEKDDDNIVNIKKEQIEDLIELIKGHIKTIENDKNDTKENNSIININDIEKYFLNSINIIKKRKNHKNETLKDFYQKINL